MKKLIANFLGLILFILILPLIFMLRWAHGGNKPKVTGGFHAKTDVFIIPESIFDERHN